MLRTVGNGNSVSFAIIGLKNTRKGLRPEFLPFFYFVVVSKNVKDLFCFSYVCGFGFHFNLKKKSGR